MICEIQIQEMSQEKMNSCIKSICIGAIEVSWEEFFANFYWEAYEEQMFLGQTW